MCPRLCRYAPGDPIESWLHELLCLDAAQHLPKPPLKLPHPGQCELYYVERDTLFSFHKVRRRAASALPCALCCSCARAERASAAQSSSQHRLRCGAVQTQRGPCCAALCLCLALVPTRLILNHQAAHGVPSVLLSCRRPSASCSRWCRSSSRRTTRTRPTTCCSWPTRRRTRSLRCWRPSTRCRCARRHLLSGRPHDPSAHAATTRPRLSAAASRNAEVAASPATLLSCIACRVLPVSQNVLPDVLAVVQVALEGEVSRRSAQSSLARGDLPQV